MAKEEKKFDLFRRAHVLLEKAHLGTEAVNFKHSNFTYPKILIRYNGPQSSRMTIEATRQKAVLKISILKGNEKAAELIEKALGLHPDSTQTQDDAYHIITIQVPLAQLVWEGLPQKSRNSFRFTREEQKDAMRNLVNVNMGQRNRLIEE